VTCNIRVFTVACCTWSWRTGKAKVLLSLQQAVGGFKALLTTLISSHGGTETSVRPDQWPNNSWLYTKKEIERGGNGLMISLLWFYFWVVNNKPGCGEGVWLWVAGEALKGEMGFWFVLGTSNFYVSNQGFYYNTFFLIHAKSRGSIGRTANWIPTNIADLKRTGWREFSKCSSEDVIAISHSV